MASAREGGCHFPFKYKRVVNYLAVSMIFRNYDDNTALIGYRYIACQVPFSYYWHLSPIEDIFNV